MADEVQFVLEVDGAYLQFDAVKPLVHLGLQACEHLVEVAHPYESVDAYALFAACEGSVVDDAPAAVLQVEQCRLYAEEHGGIGAQCVVVDAAALRLCSSQQACQHGLVFCVGQSVATEVGQGSTFAPTLYGGSPGVFCRDHPGSPRGVHAARRSRRLLEVQHLFVERQLYVHCFGVVVYRRSCYGSLGYLEKSGLRFSRNAFPPSCASSSM